MKHILEAYAASGVIGFLIGIMVFCSYEHWMLGLGMLGVVCIAVFAFARVITYEEKS